MREYSAAAVMGSVSHCFVGHDELDRFIGAVSAL
jgi:hypothetical protein